MCPCVCVQELPPATNACARTCAARGGLSSAFPQGYHEGGTEGAIVVTASVGSVPCGHPLSHEEPGLAWQRCRPEPGLQGRGASVSQELPQCRAPGGVDNSGDSPGGGRPHTHRQVLAAAVAQPEGDWCLRIYLRTEVCLSLSGFVLKAASCGAASAWGGEREGYQGCWSPCARRQTECKGTPALPWAPQDLLPQVHAPISLCVLSSAPHPPFFCPPPLPGQGSPCCPLCLSMQQWPWGQSLTLHTANLAPKNRSGGEKTNTAEFL